MTGPAFDPDPAWAEVKKLRARIEELERAWKAAHTLMGNENLRAERAEAEVARLREALEKIADERNPSAAMNFKDAITIARAALSEEPRT